MSERPILTFPLDDLVRSVCMRRTLAIAISRQMICHHERPRVASFWILRFAAGAYILALGGGVLLFDCGRKG